MAIKFRIFKRIVQLGKDKGKTKIFAQSVTTKKITFKRFCEEVADGSTAGNLVRSRLLLALSVLTRRRLS